MKTHPSGNYVLAQEYRADAQRQQGEIRAEITATVDHLANEILAAQNRVQELREELRIAAERECYWLEETDRLAQAENYCRHHDLFACPYAH